MNGSLGLTRRVVLAATAALGALGLVPRAFAQSARSNGSQQLIEKLIGKTKPQTGKIKLRIPEIAENGNTVPMTLAVDSPMTAQNHVKAVHVVTDGNPNPEVASFFFSPANGKAEVSTRIRLAQTMNVIAFAQMSDGSVWTDRAEAKVTIGGCGG